ncbi:dTDP-glucose 4,6-dehydratase [Virgibacillus oceani]
MNILVTGGAGFIGSNFIKHMLEKYPEVKIVNIDKLTYAGNLDNLKDIEACINYQFVQGDISDMSLVNSIIKKHKINIIVNFAAESHVDRSIEDPAIFIQTNVLGTQTLLDAGYRNNISKFIQISTDEVYGSLGREGYFTENSPLAPNSPYSASKAAADLLVRSYYETYHMNVNILRCSNNYGPFQFPEKLIPLMVTRALENQYLPVYGDGLHVRDWLHVKDHCNAIDLVLRRGLPGEVYNIGSHNERPNIAMVKEIINYLGKSNALIKHVEDRKGHDRRYAIDSTKVMKELDWEPTYHLDMGLKETIKWYLDNKQWWKNIINSQVKNDEKMIENVI